MPKKNEAIQVSDEMWEKIRYEYITTGISMRGIEKKYGIPYNRVKTKVDREQWNGGREMVDQKSIEAIASNKAEDCIRAFRIANKVMDKLEAIVDNIDASEVDVEKRLKSITSAIKDLKEIGVFRSSLDQAEQEARIKKLQKDAEEEQKDTNITVIIDDEVKKYCR